MTLTLADQYYLKALDEYPYSLNEVIESLNYALSYDMEHVGANCLMGQLYMEQFNSYDQAEEYFLAALAIDPLHEHSCTGYARLLIWIREYDKSQKVLDHARKLKGVGIAKVMQLESLLNEYKKDYAHAKVLLVSAMEETYDDDYMSFLQREFERVEMKEAKQAQVNYSLA